MERRLLWIGAAEYKRNVRHFINDLLLLIAETIVMLLLDEQVFYLKIEIIIGINFTDEKKNTFFIY